ncbi:ribosome biogenesis GTPase YlqF [Marinicrinis sediminis]|uniref:Ribosome biogenesis GTPase A n=1 Tax=Marinicrinis sediminis TaxID=1652465 RepID=A0ABW5R564_9BACL
MTIQWFPGHMAKARRQIEEKLKLIDVVIELLDARIPLSSRNPMIDQILQQKPRVVILNKSDMADEQVTENWVAWFAEQELEAIPVDATSGKGVPRIVQASKEKMATKFAAMRKKGINPRPVRALIVGIPNVGKSTLINRMAGRNVAATGDRPGVTKAQQWIRVGQDMELLDTPGILWPKFEDQQVGYRLAATGAIKDEILHPEDVAFHTIKYIITYYGDMLLERYDLNELPADTENPSEVVDFMEMIGRRRGCLQSGGTINLEKTSQVILRDLRTLKLGRLSFETPTEHGSDVTIG